MSHRLQVLVPRSLDACIRKAAQRCGLSRGEWVRQAIEKALAEPDRPADALDRLGSLGAPTGDIDRMPVESGAGRGSPRDVLGRRLRDRFARIGLDVEVAEIRGQRARAAKLDK